jgi:hypothetical protein
MVMASTAQAGPILGDDTPPADAASEQGKDPAQRKAESEQWRPGFGARVGGYGFRDPEGESELWDTCRMNGFGLFGTLDVNKYLFTELSVDFYQATPDVVADGLDRTSTHGLLGAGLRMLPDFVITPYIIAGGGAEHTRVELPQGVVEAVYPMGFIGLGAEINVTRELKAGAAVRMLATTRPKFADASASGSIYGSQSALTGEASSEPEMQFDVASQGQFFLRYAL